MNSVAQEGEELRRVSQESGGRGKERRATESSGGDGSGSCRFGARCSLLTEVVGGRRQWPRSTSDEVM